MVFTNNQRVTHFPHNHKRFNIPTRLLAGFILFEYLCLEEIINLIFYRYLKSSISYAEVDARTTCEDPRQGGRNA